MTLVWEYQIEGEIGRGWKGWRVSIFVDEGEATFCFDERDRVYSEDEAVARAFDEADPDGEVRFTVTPIRTLVSAEINPN